MGTDPVEIEPALSRTFEIVSHWKAILLLDEADVFVERRSADHTHRNALVSVFLRKLEYHEGVLFLTTNRVQTFDEAIASRIHLAIKYGSLNESARREVWMSFLAKANTEKGAAVYKPKDLDRLAGMELNGREVSSL